MELSKILVIDDNTEIINIIIENLEETNPEYRFFYAPDGKSGIEVAQKYKPKLILIDWEMPEMSGIETIKKLKESPKTKDILIMMMTGIMTSSKNLETAFNAGAVDYIRKPIDKIELSARIKSMLMLTDSFKKIIDLKDCKLSSMAIQEIKNNEFNYYLLGKISKIKAEFCSTNSDLESIVCQLSSEISSKIKMNANHEFLTHFENTHPSFSNNLLQDFPNLTPNELKLAAFLRLQLSSKQIASITFISPNSVKTARARLRKKLNLLSWENLTTFLHNF